MRLKGETVILVTKTGGGYDNDGRLIPPVVVRTPMQRCVIIPKGGNVASAVDYQLASKEISILTPEPVDGLEVGAELEVRGQVYEINAPVFHHKSPFGTTVGGSEIPAVWKETV